MKFFSFSAIPARRRYRRSLGVALVLVLSFLVIISGMVIAFFSMVTAEASSAGTGAAATSSKSLADSAVSFVMGSIVDATSGHDPNVADNDATNNGPANAWVWASQPGMIRSYDNSGQPRYAYKLYSSDTMRVEGPMAVGVYDTPAGSTTWATGTNRDIWTDLNEPVRDSSGYDIYPIVDPTAAEDYERLQATYPSRKDRDNRHKVEGFRVLKNGTLNISLGTDPSAPGVDTRNGNPAPMPVKWLYVLQDGTLTAAELSGSGVKLLNQRASKTNPIKGRIAFWTDDECSKVNINTASQGVYWDVPRIFSYQEAGDLATTAENGSGPQARIPGYALTQPTKGEYQRYPGHPATTSLSAIFGFSGSTPALSSTALVPVLPVPKPDHNWTATEEAQVEKYYTLTPRIMGMYRRDTSDTTSTDPSAGGSRGGLLIPKQTMPPIVQGKPQYPGQGSYWRLYSTVDELLFNSVTPVGGEIHRVPNVLNPLYTSQQASLISPDMMQKAKFFLTANSSGPEVTNFNTPRISMWPINDVTHSAPYSGVPLKITAFDELAKFCATVGDVNKENVYYVRRWNARSNTDDFLSTSRNMILYKYVQKLMTLPVPGNASGTGTFATKYGSGNVASESDQILTCVFDYIRCINMQDSTPNPLVATPVEGDPNSYPYRYTPISTVQGTSASNNAENKPRPGAGEVVPIRIGATQGFGRWDFIAGAYLLFFAAHGYTTETVRANYPYIPLNEFTNEKAVTDAMGVVFMLSFHNPMQGNAGNHPRASYSVQGLNHLIFRSGPMRLKSADGTVVADSSYKFRGVSGGGARAGKSADGDASVFPGSADSIPKDLSGMNYIENSDARTWHGRGMGGTVSPVVSMSNKIWGGAYAQFNESWPNKQCRVAGQNGLAAVGNYPFFGYTDTIPVPSANATKDPEKNYVYPSTFSVEQETSTPQQDNDIIITVRNANEYTLPAAGINPDQTGSVDVQKVRLRFPYGIFRMPAPRSSPALGEDATVLPGDGSKTYTGTFASFMYNLRMPAIGGAAGQGGYLGVGAYMVKTSDTVIGLEAAGATPTLTANSAVDHTAGDHRIYEALQEVPYSYFAPNARYGNGGADTKAFEKPDVFTRAVSKAHNMTRSVNDQGTIYEGAQFGGLANGVTYSAGRSPDVPSRVGGYVTRVSGPASWDTGIGLHKDGDYINKPDEGDQGYFRYDYNPRQYRIPYITKDDYQTNSGTFFSPNRQIPSSMMLGSIPTGIQHRQPWQTLLFHPPQSGDTNNPGAASPADHYLADLFWMPVVEPYAISQPFSTAGKINMNYQIQPFNYIRRTTAMRALMASTKLSAMSPALGGTYKPGFGESASAHAADSKYPLDLDSTMTMLDQKFLTDVYRSATEISTVYLVPKDTSLGLSGTEQYSAIAQKMVSYWGSGSVSFGQNPHQLTGNNLRDKPYADLYGRLTTKSNVFTVHVRAQSLRKALSTDPNMWISGQDQVVAEYRGSSIIERYIDANDRTLPDFAKLTAANPSNPDLNMDKYYKFRTVSSKRFSP